MQKLTEGTKDQNVRDKSRNVWDKTINHVKIQDKIFGALVRQTFFTKDKKITWTIKSKFDKLDFIKIQNYCFSKATNKKIKEKLKTVI